MAASQVNAQFISELTQVIGVMLETAVTPRPATTQQRGSFVVAVGSADAATSGVRARGGLRVYCGRTGAEALARHVAGSAVKPSEATVVEMLRGMCAQAAAAFVEKHAPEV